MFVLFSNLSKQPDSKAFLTLQANASSPGTEQPVGDDTDTLPRPLGRLINDAQLHIFVRFYFKRVLKSKTLINGGDG